MAKIEGGFMILNFYMHKAFYLFFHIFILSKYAEFKSREDVDESV